MVQHVPEGVSLFARWVAYFCLELGFLGRRHLHRIQEQNGFKGGSRKAIIPRWRLLRGAMEELKDGGVWRDVLCQRGPGLQRSLERCLF